MSFSLEVKKELSEIRMKKYCCRRAFLCGLLSDAKIAKTENECTIRMVSAFSELADIVCGMVKNVCHTNASVHVVRKMNRDYYEVSFADDSMGKALEDMELGTIWNTREPPCENCKKCFIRGAFVANGTVSEPLSGYHLEFRYKNAKRARMLYQMLSEEIEEPGIVNRKNAVGLYYKNSSAVEAVLGFLGSVRCVFDFINGKIERELRNSVNRGTNCVAGNIAKSVTAAQKQIAVISALEADGRLSMLPDELFETARQRLEYSTLSLAELAQVHVPPISKSGLSHRLQKIMDFAAEGQKRGQKSSEKEN